MRAVKKVLPLLSDPPILLILTAIAIVLYCGTHLLSPMSLLMKVGGLL